MENANNQLNFDFLTNNVKGLQSPKKRDKVLSILMIKCIFERNTFSD